MAKIVLGDNELKELDEIICREILVIPAGVLKDLINLVTAFNDVYNSEEIQSILKRARLYLGEQK